MKVWLSALSVLVLGAFSLPALADHHEVFIHDVVLVDADTCAVELEISENNQDNFQSVDRIEIDGVLLADLGPVVAEAINIGGNVNAGDSILFASDDFVAETGLQADVTFDDSNCSSFTSGAVFTFVIDDPNFGGPNTVIDSLTLPSGFGVNTAAVRNSGSSSPSLITLNDETVTVTNNLNQNIVLGTDVDVGGDGGCHLGATAGTGFGWLLVAAEVFALSLLRRRK